MLEIRLERALEPASMAEGPCGVCGVDFEPEAVLACLVTPHDYIPTCEVCLKHLAERAEAESIPADWNRVYADYLIAVAKYLEPVFPSAEALGEFEKTDRRWVKLERMLQV